MTQGPQTQARYASHADTRSNAQLGEVGRGDSDSRYGFEETASQDGAADRCTKFLGSPSGFRTLWDTGYSQGYESGLEGHIRRKPQEDQFAKDSMCNGEFFWQAT